MTQHVYEGMFILDPNRYARDPGKVARKIPQMIESFGGEILVNRLWIEQKLAYPIRGHRKGTYWLTYFRMDSDKLAELARACRLEETILRNLVLKIEPRLVDAMVAHALGTKSTDEPDKVDKTDKADKADKTDEPENADKTEETDKVKETDKVEETGKAAATSAEAPQPEEVEVAQDEATPQPVTAVDEVSDDHGDQE